MLQPLIAYLASYLALYAAWRKHTGEVKRRKVFLPGAERRLKVPKNEGTELKETVGGDYKFLL